MGSDAWSIAGLERSTLFGANAPFIEELYERYLADPASVDAEWRAYFDELRGDAADVSHAPVVESFRRARARTAASPARWSMRPRCTSRCWCCASSASTARSACSPPTSIRCSSTSTDYIADLDLATYGFTEADMDTEFDVGSYKAGPQRMRLRDIVAALQETYTRTLGAEYMYITDTATKRFFQERLEPIRSRPELYAGGDASTSSSA